MSDEVERELLVCCLRPHGRAPCPSEGVGLGFMGQSRRALACRSSEPRAQPGLTSQLAGGFKGAECALRLSNLRCDERKERNTTADRHPSHSDQHGMRRWDGSARLFRVWIEVQDTGATPMPHHPYPCLRQSGFMGTRCYRSPVVRLSRLPGSSPSAASVSFNASCTSSTK